MASGGNTSKKAGAAAVKGASEPVKGDSTDPDLVPAPPPPPPAAVPRASSPSQPPTPRREPAAPAPGPSAGSWKLVTIRGPKAGTEFLLKGDSATFGRGTDNVISIPDVSVSRHHARFDSDETGVSVTDLDSGNGTKVNGARVASARLQDGDEVVFGDTCLQLIRIDAPAAAPKAKAKAKAPAAPSGDVAAPSAPTVNPPARVHVKPRPAPEADVQTTAQNRAIQPAPIAVVPVQRPPGKTSGGRMILYLVLFVLMIVFFGGAWFLKNANGGDLIPSGPPPDPSIAVLQQAKEKIKNRRWTEAAQILDEGASAHPSDESIRKWAESAHFDASAQKLFEDARAALARGDYASAMSLASKVPEEADYGTNASELLKGMPGVLETALGEARTALHDGDRERARDIVERILAANPEDADASALRDEILHPPRVKAPEPPPRAPPPPRDVVPVGPNYKCYGPAITAYLQDDLKSALKYAGMSSIATCPTLTQMLNDFQTHYSKAVDLASGKHIPEASLEFKKAVQIDDQIAEARPSRPGRSAREQLANMEYLLALDCKGDDQLGRRAQHLRAAAAANPGNELVKKELDKAYVRAKEMYQEAYVNQDSDPDAARKQFRVIVQVLPPGDEVAVKATHRLTALQQQAP